MLSSERVTSDAEGALRRQQGVLVRLATAVAADPRDLDAAYRAIAQAGADELAVGRVSIWKFSDDQGSIRCVHFYERDGAGHVPGGTEELATLANPAYFAALDEARAVSIADALRDPISRPFLEPYLMRHQITSMCDAPIRLHGRLVGVICHEQTHGMRDWSAHDIAFSGTMADFLALAIEGADRLLAESRIRHLTGHDPTTGLPRVRLFLDLVERAIESGHGSDGPIAVVYLDLDRFHDVNALLGHERGDRVLATVAQRLIGASRPLDVVARIGGDCFAVLAEGLAGVDEAAELARQLAAAIVGSTPPELGAKRLTATIGVVAVAADAAGSALELLRRSAIAADLARPRGPGSIELFDAIAAAAAFDSLALETELAGAVDRDELELWFQPEIEIASGRTVGLEALVRWRRASGELVPASRFIDLAERRGLIDQIGDWVVTRAAEEAGRLAREAASPGRLGSSSPPILRVNVSPLQLGRPEFARRILAELARCGVAPNCFCLEVTESAWLERGTASRQALMELKEGGVRLAIDDFGTGYSTLAYLRQLPIDAVKIDRSFVAGVDSDAADFAIVESVVGLARRLGMDAIAEGVERTTQLNALRALGCPRAQGFLFAEPMPASALLTWSGWNET